MGGTAGEALRGSKSYQALVFLFHFLRWVNRKDPSGKNIFGGGFLGLDNIGKDTLFILQSNCA